VGRLVRLFGAAPDSDFACDVVRRQEGGDEPGIAAFKEWPLAEAGRAP
jgi:hypothetical protein